MTMINNERHYSEEEVEYLLRNLAQIISLDTKDYFKIEKKEDISKISNVPNKEFSKYLKNKIFDFEKSEFSNDISSDNEIIGDVLAILMLSAYNHDEDFNDMMEEVFG